MSFKFLASFIIFSIFISLTIKRQAKSRKNEDSDFWARELKSNSVRRKSLDTLNYVHIPLESFPTNLMNDNPEVLDCINTIEFLTSQKIVNLTGWSNTDLKLEYGTANITALSDYDQNYTLLVRTLQKWADILLDAGHGKEAAILMEFAVNTRTDISRTYYQLADYWAFRGEKFRIEELIRTAEGLSSSNRDNIIRNLKEKYSY